MENTRILTTLMCLPLFFLVLFYTSKYLTPPFPKRRWLFVSLFFGIAVSALFLASLMFGIPGNFFNSGFQAGEQLWLLIYSWCAVLVAISLGVIVSHLLSILRQKWR